MVFSQRELATVLAALRFWARTGISGTPLEHSIATEGEVLRPLNTEEVDVLCERLNTVDDHEAKRVLVSVSCQGEPNFPHPWESKIPHPVQASASCGRTRPAFNFSFSRYELPRMFSVTA